MVARRPFAFDSVQAEALFRASLTATLIVDEDGQILEANPAATIDLGWTRTELVERRWQDITHPDDINADESEVDRLQEKLETGRQYEMTKRYRRKGTSGWVWRRLVVTTYIHPDTGEFYMFISQIAPLEHHAGSDGVHAMIEEAVGSAMTRIVGHQLVEMMKMRQAVAPQKMDVKVSAASPPPWLVAWWPMVQWGLATLAAGGLLLWGIARWSAKIEPPANKTPSQSP